MHFVDNDRPDFAEELSVARAKHLIDAFVRPHENVS
jgi:hypothetical protein